MTQPALQFRPWDGPTVPAPAHIKGCPVVACASLAGRGQPQSWAAVCEVKGTMTLHLVRWNGAYVVTDTPETELTYEDALEEMMMQARRALVRLEL